MVGHLFQNYDTIYVQFFATHTCDLCCFVGFFFPNYVTIFFSNAHKWSHTCEKKPQSRKDRKNTWQKTARISCHNFETNGRP